MSGDVDPEDKTEEPTEKRLHDAVERGEVAFSREAPLFASLSATLLVLIFVIPTQPKPSSPRSSASSTIRQGGGSSAAKMSLLSPAPS